MFKLLSNELRWYKRYTSSIESASVLSAISRFMYTPEAKAVVLRDFRLDRVDGRVSVHIGNAHVTGLIHKGWLREDELQQWADKHIVDQRKVHKLESTAGLHILDKLKVDNTLVGSVIKY